VRRLIKAVDDWYSPRKLHSFLGRLGRNLVVFLPLWPYTHLYSKGVWWDGLDYVIYSSFAFALGQYAYFYSYGGTDEDYPFPPAPRSRHKS
jgi:hypothetical protein